MAEAHVVAFNLGAFISTLFLLEFGAEKFIAHTSAIAGRIGVSEVVIGILTAGAEWEELAVVGASLKQGRASLAIGNVIGAAISNILGAFSLGLVLYRRGETIEFDRSSRIYSLILLVLTTWVTIIIRWPTRTTWLVSGPLLIATFLAYFLVAVLAVGRGVLTAPEDSDDSDGDGDDDHGDDDRSVGSTTGLLADGAHMGPRRNQQWHKRRKLAIHGVWLVFGFLAICLAGYVLSQAATNIIDQFGISDVLFGVVVLAMATTLPEKFMAIMSGYRGHPGILVANCAGSNIFLLSLCCGIIMVNTGGVLDSGNVAFSELAVLWASTATLTVTIWFGARLARTIGALMIAGYVAFILLEFTVIHKVTG